MSDIDIYFEMQMQANRIARAQHTVSKTFTTAEIIEVINAKKNRQWANRPAGVYPPPGNSMPARANRQNQRCSQ